MLQFDFGQPTVHELYETRALKCPNCIAISCGDRQLTYLRLNEKANQLSRYLIQIQHVVVGDSVAIYSESSDWVVVSMLAVLKAGGVCVPVSNKLSSQQVRYMLEDANAKIILSQSDLSENDTFSGFSNATFEYLEQAISHYPKFNLTTQASSGHLAYLFYKDLTVDLPVGVEIAHRGISSLVSNISFLPIDQSLTFLQLSEMSSNVSVFEIWAALLNGHRLVISQKALIRLPQIVQLIEDEGVNCLCSSTALFDQLVDRYLSVIKSFKCLLIEGLELSSSHLQRAKNEAGNTMFIGFFALIENTVFASYFDLREVADSDRPLSVIGKPIGETTLFLLNEDFSITPCGDVGELFVGGEGLALGYHNQPKLTKERFIKCEIEKGDTRLLFKSGIRFRKLPSGDFEPLIVEKQKVGENENESVEPIQSDLLKPDYQQSIKQVWQEIFDQKDVSLESHFFELGGDSLQAAMMLFELFKRFNVRVPFPDFYSEPYLFKLLSLVEEYKDSKNEYSVNVVDHPKTNPLSSFQEQKWLALKSKGDDLANNITIRIDVSGKLNIPAIHKAFNRLVQKHDSLRTSFLIKEETPYQQINNYEEIPFSFNDFSGLSPSEIEENLFVEALKPLSLEAKSLVKWLVYRLSTEYHILFINIHSLIFDDASFVLLLNELERYYNAFCENIVENDDQKAIGYADFVQWQNQQDRAKQVAFWQNKLGEDPSATLVESDFSYPDTQKLKYKNIESRLSDQKIVQLKALSKEHGATLPVFLLTCFKIVLYKYTNHKSVLIGTLFENRCFYEFSQIIGLFSNKIIVSTDVSDDYTFKQMLSQVHHVFVEAIQNNQILAQHAINSNLYFDGLTKFPLSQILFEYRDLSQPQLQFKGLDSSVCRVDYSSHLCNLSFTVKDFGEKMIFSFDYNTSLYQEESINRILFNLNELIDIVLANPLLTIGAIQLDVPSKAKETAIDVAPRLEEIAKVDYSEKSLNEKRLLKIYRHVLNDETITIVDDFIQKGGNISLARRVVDEINLEFKTRYWPGVIFKHPQIEDLLNFLEKPAHSNPIDGVVKIKEGSGVPIFLVPGLGGDSTSFYCFAQNFAADNPLYVFEYPKSVDGKRPFQDIQELASCLIRKMKKIQPSGVYHLMGLSMGGKVIFEIALQLQGAFNKVGLVMIIDTLGVKKYWFRNWWFNKIFDELYLFCRVSFRSKIDYLIERKNYLYSKYIKKEEELITNSEDEYYLQMLQIWESYHTKEQLNSDIILFKKHESMCMKKRSEYYINQAFPMLYWDNNINGKIHLHELFCGHGEFLTEENIQHILMPIYHYLKKSEMRSKN